MSKKLHHDKAFAWLISCLGSLFVFVLALMEATGVVVLYGCYFIGVCVGAATWDLCGRKQWR